MAYFDYGAAAELFPRQRSRMMGAVTYMRFVAAAEAIRYAVEVLPAKSFLGTFLEVNEERFDSDGIRRLYDRAEYPLPRQPAAIRDRLLSVRRLPSAGSRGAHSSVGNQMTKNYPSYGFRTQGS
jgi:hypothetical protein